MAPPNKKRGKNPKSVKVAIRTNDDIEEISSDESEDKVDSTEEETKNNGKSKKKKNFKQRYTHRKK